MAKYETKEGDYLPQVRWREIDNATLRRLAYHFIGHVALSALESGSEWHDAMVQKREGTQADADRLVKLIREISERLISRGGLDA